VNGSVNLITVMLTAMKFFLEMPPSSCLFCIKGIPACVGLLKEWKKKEKNSSEESLAIKELTDLSQKIEKRCECGYAHQALNPIRGCLQYLGSPEIQESLHELRGSI
jgi:NADH:ubiquinone oxidoreductase subunit F (NADH-binding)